MDVGRRIREIRERKGIEQIELAEKIDISQSKMNKIETGYQKRIEPEVLTNIARVLGTSTDFLLTGKESTPYTTTLTEKDERDIAKRMKKLREDLTKGDGLSFHGEPLSEEAIESLLDAIEYAERQATRINKKYIPKKYRKDNSDN